MRSLIILATLIALVGCGGPPAVERPALEAVLYQDGDAPLGWQAGQVRDTMTGTTEGAAMVVSRELIPAVASPLTGEVGVALYADAAAAKVGLQGLLPGLTTDGQPYEVGDQGLQRGNIVGFQRCRAVAVVRLALADGLDQIGSYARRLDERLQKLVC
jgi:hypothetical protein